MKLYQRTYTMRTTLKQEAEVILGPDEDGPPNSYRQVQVLVPDGPKALIGIDIPVQTAFNNPVRGGMGVNRTYILSEFPPSRSIRFKLLPEQFLTGASEQGLAFVSLIVEHCLGEE